MFVKKKVKNRKRISTQQNNTIDYQHSIFLEQQKMNIEKVSNLNKKLKKTKIELKKIKEIKINNLNNAWKKKLELENSIENIKNEIAEISKINDDYFMNTGHLLFEYYECKNTKNEEKNSTPSQKDVLHFFNEKEITDIKEKEMEKKNLNDIIKKYSLKTHFTGDNPELDKNIQHYFSSNEKFIETCKTCNCFKIISNNDTFLICPKCGVQEYILFNHEKPSYKEPPKEYTHFAYKRINHFNEWLSQYQAKESTFIPEDIINLIRKELQKERLGEQQIKNIPNKKIRQYLKKLGLNKYYEHVPHIKSKLTGCSPPIISRETEELLRIMFRQIQLPFFNHCPKSRKNFLSYSYVLNKFTQLLDMDALSKCFPLLKSRTKLYQQDIIWKGVCSDLNWQFIKSV